jgi:hypothetical protein
LRLGQWTLIHGLALAPRQCHDLFLAGALAIALAGLTLRLVALICMIARRPTEPSSRL